MKITIIGAGNVGGMAAMRIAQMNLGDVLLIDIVPGLSRAKAFDMDDCRQILKSDRSPAGSEDIADLKGSQIIVVTAGLARKPGMTREDLLQKNAAIVKGICAGIQKGAPAAVVIMVTNPLDVMTYYALRQLGFATGRVFGMGSTLDGSRFATQISAELNVPASRIAPMVLGSHGEAMLPVPRLTLVDGKPLTEVVRDPEVIARLVRRTVDRGKEIVGLYGSGSAYFAPSAAIAELVQAVAGDEKTQLPVSALVSGEYGLSDICIGTPCVIGRNGIERIVELKLTPQELSDLRASAESIRSLQALV